MTGKLWTVVGAAMLACACERPALEIGGKIAVDIVGVPPGGISQVIMNLTAVELELAEAEEDVVNSLKLEPSDGYVLAQTGPVGLRVVGAQTVPARTYDSLVLHLGSAPFVVVGATGERTEPADDQGTAWRLPGPIEVSHGEITELVVSVHLTADETSEISPRFGLVDRAKAARIEGRVAEDAFTTACLFKAEDDQGRTGELGCGGAFAVTPIVGRRYAFPPVPEGAYDVRLLRDDGSFHSTSDLPVKAGEVRVIPPPVPRPALVHGSP